MHLSGERFSRLIEYPLHSHHGANEAMTLVDLSFSAREPSDFKIIVLSNEASWFLS